MIKSKKPMSLVHIKPKGVNQERIIREYNRGKNLLVHGYAGTGKSLLAMYLALNTVMVSEDFDKVMIIRSCVPSRAQGFLPGDPNEKNEVFEAPYEYLAAKLLDNTPSPYKALKGLDVIEFVSTSYLRGQTIERTIVIADEIQNMNDSEINTIITRIGKDSRLIMLGDEEQNDLKNLREVSCMQDTIRTVKLMPEFSTIRMDVDDICRNGLIKSWVLARIDIKKENLPSFIKE